MKIPIRCAALILSLHASANVFAATVDSVNDVVRDCGANNTGTSNAAPAIQSCINRGGHVRVPAGLYSVRLKPGGYALQIVASNTTLELASGAIIKLANNQINGASAGRMLRIGDGITAISNARVTGAGTLDGNKISNGPVPVPIDKGAVIYIYGPVSDSGVYGINIVNGTGDCIWIEGIAPNRRSQRITIDGTHQTGCREGTVWLRADGVAVRNNYIRDIEVQDGIEPAQTSSNWSIENNHLENIAQSGMDIFDGANNGRAVNNVLINTSMDSGDAITVGGVTLPVTDVLIDSNIISGTGYGNGIATLQNDPITTARIKISNNIVHGAKRTGIRLWGTAKQISVSGNSIYENGEDGIYSRGNGVLITGNNIYSNNMSATANVSGLRLENCSDVLVAGNMITNTAGESTQDHGVFVQSGANRIQITGNQISNNNANGLLSQGNNLQIRGNTVFNNNQGGYAKYNSSQGIRIEGNNNTVQSNEVFDDQALAMQTFGILATTTATGSLIEDNVIRGNAFGAVTDLSGHAMIRRNSGYVTESNGTATIAANATSVSVDHGLSSLPSIAEIQVTPLSNMGAAANFWVNDVTESQFTVHVNKAPGVAIMFAWSVIRN